MDKCKFRVSIPGKNLSVDMTASDAEKWFFRLTKLILLNEEEAPPLEVPVESELKDKQVEQKKVSFQPKELQGALLEQEKSRENNLASSAESYKGFLRIRCSGCGEIRGFSVKSPITASWCKCGVKTDLVALTRMKAKCNVCGHVWSYQTNNKEPLDEFSCIECGAPITMQRDKYGDYQTIETEE